MKRYIEATTRSFTNLPLDEALDIAADPNTSEEILEELAAYPNDSVLLAIKHNPSSSSRILELPAIAKVEDATVNFYVDCYCEGTEYAATGNIHYLEPAIRDAIILNGGVFEDLDIIISDDEEEDDILDYPDITRLMTIAVTFSFAESPDALEIEDTIGAAILNTLESAGFDIHFAEFG